jgi:hypothetical protein
MIDWISLLYVRLTFLHNQTRWSHKFYTCSMPHHEYARVDGVIYSTDPIFSVLCSQVLYLFYAASWVCEGWWSDLFHGSHLLGSMLMCFICVLSVCKSCEGWHVLFKMNMSWFVMSPHFTLRVRSALRLCEARIHSIQTEGVRGWTLSMQRLDAWIMFL